VWQRQERIQSNEEMPGTYILKYRDGRTEEYYSHQGYYYVLGPERLLHFEAEPAWCQHCKRVSLAEGIPEPAEIEADIKKMCDPESEWRRERSAKHPAWYFSELETALKEGLKFSSELWSGRKARRRCLTCGQPGVVFFVWRKWFPHPLTGEEVMYECVGIFATTLARRFFDREGIEIYPTEEERQKFKRIND
jgi:hypothetical protein